MSNTVVRSMTKILTQSLVQFTEATRLLVVHIKNSAGSPQEKLRLISMRANTYQYCLRKLSRNGEIAVRRKYTEDDHEDGCFLLT